MVKDLKALIEKMKSDLRGVYNALLRKEYVIGLDLGSSSVKMALFTSRKGRLVLVKAGIKEMEATSDEMVPDDRVASAIEELLKGIDRNRSKFIVSLNCSKSCVRKITAPHMPMAELADGVRLEAKNLFPFSIDEASIGYEVMGDVAEDGINKYQILLAASPQDTIDRHLSILRKAGIKPAAFIPAPIALRNVAVEACVSEEGATAVLDIGDSMSEFLIIEDRKIRFSRKIPVTGRDFTEAMTGALVSDRGEIKLSIDEAEKIKRSIGIPSESEHRIVDEKVSTAQLGSMLRSPLDQLVNEIGRCFDYYREESGGGKINAIYLCGGGSLLKGLPNFLSRELEMTVALGNPLDGEYARSAYGRKDKGEGERFAPAIGAALTGSEGLNLLPVGVREETKRIFQRAGLQSTAIALVLVLAFVYIGMRIQLRNWQRRIDVAGMQLDSLQPQMEKVEAYRVLVDEPYWEEVFKELGNIVPENTYLDEIRFEGGSMTLKGTIDSTEEAAVSDLVIILEKGLFNNVRLISSRDVEGRESISFVITCQVE